MRDNKITALIIGAAMRVHDALGPGLLESAYEECLCYELRKSALYVEKQKALPLVYESVKMECGYRIDLLVDKRIIVEVKVVDTFSDVHLAQVLTYLRLANLKLGLLLNFNVVRLKHGIKRVINNL